MLNFDASQPLRNPRHYATLLEAIHKAHPSDETHWLEWKSELDLKSAEGRFALAKEILAMCNRWPADMQSIAGRGVVVVGMAPGAATGVRRIDPADLYQRLAPYLGDEPRWSAQWFEFEGVAVLVVTVEPPAAGDPIFTLQKNFGSAIDGAIFIRSGTRAVPANSTQIRALTDRAAPAVSEPSLAIDITVETDGPLKFVTWDNSVVEEWLDAKERALLRPLDPPSPSLYPGLASIESVASMSIAQATAWSTQPESRTEDEFRDEVEQARSVASDRAREAFLVFLSPLLPATRVKARNLSTANLADLEVRAHVAGSIDAFRRYDDTTISHLHSEMPKWPAKWGPKPIPALGSLLRSQSYVPGDFGPTTQIFNGGSFALEFPSADLRPRAETVLNADQDLVLVAPPEGTEMFEFKWHATASNIDAVAEGIAFLEFSGETVDLTDLVAAALDELDK